MSNKHFIVDKVKSLDLPNRHLAAAQGVGVPGHVVVHLSDGAALLDLADPQAVVWEAVLDDVRQANEPVFLEMDATTNVIKQVLLPQSVVVTDIAPAPVGVRHEVTLEISHARHYLNTTNPDYQQLFNALSVARKQGTSVLVTETLDDHEIIDVRPDPTPFVGGPAMMVIPPAGPFGNLNATTAGITPQKAQQLFSLVANQSYIPFKYPDDGCWGRAHEMCRLIIANGVSPRKVWIYGNLMVSTRNHPNCKL